MLQQSDTRRSYDHQHHPIDDHNILIDQDKNGRGYSVNQVNLHHQGNQRDN